MRVVFHWRGDRFAHTVERLVEARWSPCLASLEGTPDDDWPPSPALQNLHVEQRMAGPVALLVGRAGTSHWSASVEPLLHCAGFSIDVACRIHVEPERLGSRYRFLTSDGAQLITISTDEMTSQANTSADGNPVVTPFATTDSIPNTVRWRYQLRAGGTS